MGSSVVELDFLSVDRFNRTLQSPDQVEEDVHRSRMRELRAKWYAGEWEYVQKELQVQNPSELVLILGWPEGGGVWLLKTTDAPGLDIGRVANATSMSERYDVIRKLGGVFYAAPEDCPDLKL